MKLHPIQVAEPTASSAVMPHKKKQFKGYTIEELKLQRALVDVRREYVKDKLQQDFHRLTTDGISGESHSKASLWWNVGGKVLQLLSYSDYLSLGINIFNQSRKVIGFLRHKK